MSITIEDVDQKLEQLREQWKTNPAKRQIIKRQARALQIAKEKIMHKQGRWM